MVGVSTGRWSDLFKLQKLGALSLSGQFLLAATAVMFLSMAVLGALVSQRIQSAVLDTASEEWADFLGVLLEPHLQDLSPGDLLSATQIAAFDRLFVDTPLGKSLLAIKVWTPGGRLIYNTSGVLVGQTFMSEEIALAAGGARVIQLEDASPESEFERQRGLPLIELYAPLRNIGTGQIIAVGELYEEATALVDELSASRLATWLVVCLTTLLMLSVLYLIVRRGGTTIQLQQAELNRRIAEATQLAGQNADLSNLADAARLDASAANEQLLARIGADLHDGPIQTLSLLMLKLSAGPSGTEAVIDEGIVSLTASTLFELRGISAGLSMPEIQELTLTETLQLAVLRYEDLAGTSVVTNFRALPTQSPAAVRTCAYRIVQEALNNAHKHAPTARQTVSCHANETTVFVSIEDNGPGLGQTEKGADQRHKLGLAGMRNRVAALRGSINVASSEGEGTRIDVALPLDPTYAGEPLPKVSRGPSSAPR